jgi:hypothetical protein
MSMIVPGRRVRSPEAVLVTTTSAVELVGAGTVGDPG